MFEYKKKVLTKSSTDAYFDGVIGGIARYFNIDSTLLRIIFLAAIFLSEAFPIIIVYFVLMLLLPEDTEDNISEVSLEEPE